MPVRSFGVDADKITVSQGATTNPSGGATMVMLVNPQAIFGGNGYMSGRNSTATPVGLFAGTGSGDLDAGCDAGDSTATTSVTTGSWQWVAFTKATGATTATLHRGVYGSTWTHTVGTGSYTFSSTATLTFEFGACSGGNAQHMYVAVAAYFQRALTNLELESFVDHTSQIYNASGGHPVALWEFNQASTATNVTDATGGGANQTALAGTTVVTGSDPSGFTFDGIGAGGGGSTIVSPVQSFGPSYAATRAASI